MGENLARQLAYGIFNAPIRPFPYPHIYVENIFPQEVYARLQENIPHPDAMIPIEQARSVRGYKERFVLDISSPMETVTDQQRAFWREMRDVLLGGGIRNVFLNKFKAQIQERLSQMVGAALYDESLLVEDITRYALGPHTDAPPKVITVLFYLPPDNSQIHLGTSLYMPKDPARRCPGGPHYKFDEFDRVATMPFAPNSMFAFVKNDLSFHGVEPVTDPDVKRWLLLYDIRVRMPAVQPAPVAPDAVTTA